MAENRTKRVTHDATFLAKVATDPTGALASMVMQAFGVSLDQLTTAVELMFSNKDDDVVTLAVDAGIQIRGNVTFVTINMGGGKLRERYPTFLISSQRDTGDDFNFSALHAAGHVICIVANSRLAQKILAKSGNCITGTSFPDSVAGKINHEIKNSWTEAELTAFNAWVNGLDTNLKAWVSTVVESIPEKANAYRAKGSATSGASSGKVSGVPPAPSRPVS